MIHITCEISLSLNLIKGFMIDPDVSDFLNSESQQQVIMWLKTAYYSGKKLNYVFGYFFCY